MSATLAAAPTAPATGPAVGAVAPDRDFEVLRAQIASLLRRGNYVAAEEAARSLLERVERDPVRASLPAAEALDSIVEVAIRLKGSTSFQAQPLAELAVRIRQQRLGNDSSELAPSLENLAQILALGDKPVKGLTPARRALTLTERSFGAYDPRVARALRVEAMVHCCLDEGSRAEPLLRRALAIHDVFPDGDREERASVIHLLGRSIKAQERFNDAAPFLHRARELYAGLFGANHPMVADTEESLGDLFFLTGRYHDARAMFEHVLSVYRSAAGRDSVRVAEVLDSLAGVLWRFGDFQGARRAARQALAIMEKLKGTESTDIVQNLNHLALIEMDLGNHEEARALNQRALGIAAAGGDRYWEAVLSHNLAEAEFLDGDYAGAGTHYRRALAFENRSVPRWLVTQASTLDSYAKLQAQVGDLDQAMSLNARALAIREQALGSQHHLYADTLNARAKMQLARGDAGNALRTSLRAEAIGRSHFRRTAIRLSEREALDYQKIRISGLDVALSALVLIPGGDETSTLVRGLWDELIRSRALVLDEIASRHRSLLRSRDRRIAAILDRLQTAREQLAQRVVAGPGTSGVAVYDQEVRRAEDEVQRTERSLAQLSEPFRASRTRAEAGWLQVKAAVPQGTALVAYARYHPLGGPEGRIDFTPIEETSFSRNDASQKNYVALVLPSGSTSPIVVRLDGSEHLDEAVARWRDEAGSPPEGLSLADSRAERNYRTAGERVRSIAWDPVARRLGRARQVFVVPDGVLNTVNLGALPDTGGHYLVETGPLVHYLSAERDLLRANARPPSGKGLVVLGDPDFDRTGQTSDATAFEASWRTATGPLATDQNGPYRGALPPCETFQSLRFTPLPGALLESQEIASLWRAARSTGTAEDTAVLELIGPNATEGAFKHVAPRYRVIHVATHAFLIGERCLAAPDDGLERISGARPEENPLLLSGLALAGANRRSAPTPSPDGEDGVLTGEEIASLDLSRVQWVVLSACETAGGVVRAGEGVLGLRRAFEVAGAGTLIMSLWPVEDSSTREWMRSLYQARLKGASTAAATRDASVAMISRLRRAGRSTHPHLWGAFVATGDWR